MVTSKASELREGSFLFDPKAVSTVNGCRPMKILKDQPRPLTAPLGSFLPYATGLSGAP